MEIFLASRRRGEGRVVSFLVISSCVSIPGWVGVIVQTSGVFFRNGQNWLKNPPEATTSKSEAYADDLNF